MEELTNAVRLELLAIGVTPTVLIGVLAWWFRERLKQSLAKALNSHTELVKLDAQRAIEAYRVTLVTEIEQLKAKVERSKSLALRHSTAGYEALMALHAAINLADTATLTFATFRPSTPLTFEQRVAELEKVTAALEVLRDATAKAEIFLPPNVTSDLLQLRKDLMNAAYDYGFAGGEAMPGEQARAVLARSAALSRALRASIEELTRI